MNEALRQARERKNWSQQALAQRVNVTKTYISRLEAGKNQPGVGLALRIADVLDVTVRDLWQADPAPEHCPGQGDLFN